MDTLSNCKIKLVQRNKQGAAYGLRTGWAEYQIWSGRKIISRHETYREARLAADALEDAEMAALRKMLAEPIA
jgi:hypothetical protein